MSAPDLKAEVLAVLKGTSSKRPMSTRSIIDTTRRQRSRVEAALAALYQERHVYCCKIIKAGEAFVVWWCAGAVPAQTEFYGKQIAAPAEPARKVVCRISKFSRDVIDTIKAAPGMSMRELKAKLAAKGETDSRIASTACNLVCLGHLRTEGAQRQYRYFVGKKV